MRAQLITTDQLIARVASRQHGVITFAQLLGVGLSRPAVNRRVAAGRLIRVHRGVYRVGHTAPSWEADYLAAVLACQPDGLLGGRASGFLYRITKGGPPPPEIIAPAARARPGITTRRTSVSGRDVTTYRGIPTLTIPATIVDLAAILHQQDLTEAVDRADKFHNVTVDAIAAAARRRPHAPGIATLRQICTGDDPILLSEMERLFRATLAASALPLPLTNRRVDDHYVDCRWPDHHLTVELDSYRFHRSRKAWEQSYERRRAARRRGDEFRSYTWFDVAEDQSHMLGELRDLLPTRR